MVDFSVVCRLCVGEVMGPVLPSLMELGDVEGPRDAGESEETSELPAGDAVTLDPWTPAAQLATFFIFITEMDRLISASF